MRLPKSNLMFHYPNISRSVGLDCTRTHTRMPISIWPPILFKYLNRHKTLSCCWMYAYAYPRRVFVIYRVQTLIMCGPSGWWMGTRGGWGGPDRSYASGPGFEYWTDRRWARSIFASSPFGTVSSKHYDVSNGRQLTLLLFPLESQSQCHAMRFASKCISLNVIRAMQMTCREKKTNHSRWECLLRPNA